MKKIASSLLFCALFAALFSGCEDNKYDLFSTLYGVITDNQTGNPISGATVVLSPGGKTKMTGSDGLFEFNDLEAIQYTITVQKTDYQTNRKTITAVSGEKTEVSISLTKNN